MSSPVLCCVDHNNTFFGKIFTILIFSFQNAVLAKFSDAVRSNLTKIQRLKIVSLVTIEIHARDVIEKMYKMSKRVSPTNSNFKAKKKLYIKYSQLLHKSGYFL